MKFNINCCWINPRINSIYDVENIGVRCSAFEPKNWVAWLQPSNYWTNDFHLVYVVIQR